MKRVFIILLLVIDFAFCQDKQPKINRNEIKLNVLGAAVWGLVDLSYEYILNKKYAIGSGIVISYAAPYGPHLPGTIPKFAFRPFFKHYILEDKYGEGFFLKLLGDISYYSAYKEFFVEPPVITDARVAVGPALFFGYKKRMKNLIIEFDIGLDTVIVNYIILPRLSLHSLIGIYVGVAF